MYVCSVGVLDCHSPKSAIGDFILYRLSGFIYFPNFDSVSPEHQLAFQHELFRQHILANLDILNNDLAVLDVAEIRRVFDFPLDEFLHFLCLRFQLNNLRRILVWH